jgi:hypothetical protein
MSNMAAVTAEIAAKFAQELAAPLPPGITRGRTWPEKPHGIHNTLHGWTCPDCGAKNPSEYWLWVQPAVNALANHRRSDCPGPAKTITITRLWLTNPGQMSRWSYNYTISGNPMTHQYGPRLGDLRAMLRRKHPGATVVEAWMGR